MRWRLPFRGRRALGFAFEAFDLEAGGVDGLDSVGEGFGRVGAPGDRAVAQGDVVGVLDGEAGGVVRLDGGDGRGGAVVEEIALELRGAVESDGDAVEGDVVDAAGRASADADGVFGCAGNVLHVMLCNVPDFDWSPCAGWR